MTPAEVGSPPNTATALIWKHPASRDRVSIPTAAGWWVLSEESDLRVVESRPSCAVGRPAMQNYFEVEWRFIVRSLCSGSLCSTRIT